MKKKLFKSLLVTLAVVGIFSVGVFAGSNMQAITAYLNYGITVEYNDVDQVMYDANGGRVYPITYNNTTYLPVRAVSNMLGVNVNWDEATQHVLLGNSYVDYTAPSTPTPSTPAPSATSPSGVDCTFVAPAVNGAGLILDESSINSGAYSNGHWVAKRWAIGDDVAVTFPTLTFVTEPYGNKVAIQKGFDALCSALESRGYVRTKYDVQSYTDVHYVKGNSEFQVTNFGGMLTIKGGTKWHACCVNF